MGSAKGSPPRMRGKDFAAVPAVPGLLDHPRVCGEKIEVSLTVSYVQGSPPRMRGKVPYLQGLGPPSWDHPRVCGEKYLLCSQLNETGGSPPRMRGKVGLAPLVELLIGITPAYAGKRYAPMIRILLFRDHPRVCGEKPCGTGSGWRWRRITPAYAGKRGHRERTGRAGRDHPRVCGEKPCPPAGRGHRRGSPPRMRGKAKVFPCSLQLFRITPAYAGKSCS